jgi:hypothetical protein
MHPISGVGFCGPRSPTTSGLAPVLGAATGSGAPGRRISRRLLDRRSGATAPRAATSNSRSRPPDRWRKRPCMAVRQATPAPARRGCPGLAGGPTAGRLLRGPPTAPRSGVSLPAAAGRFRWPWPVSPPPWNHTSLAGSGFHLPAGRPNPSLRRWPPGGRRQMQGGGQYPPSGQPLAAARALIPIAPGHIRQAYDRPHIAPEGGSGTPDVGDHRGCSVLGCLRGAAAPGSLRRESMDARPAGGVYVAGRRIHVQRGSPPPGAPIPGSWPEHSSTRSSLRPPCGPPWMALTGRRVPSRCLRTGGSEGEATAAARRGGRTVVVGRVWQGLTSRLTVWGPVLGESGGAIKDDE